MSATDLVMATLTVLLMLYQSSVGLLILIGIVIQIIQ